QHRARSAQRHLARSDQLDRCAPGARRLRARQSLAVAEDVRRLRLDVAHDRLLMQSLVPQGVIPAGFALVIHRSDRTHTESVPVGTLQTWRLTWTQAPAIVSRSRPRISTTSGVTSWIPAPCSSRTWAAGRPSRDPSARSAACGTTRS